MSETMQMLLVYYGAISVPALVAVGVTVFLYRKYGRRRGHYHVAKREGALRV